MGERECSGRVTGNPVELSPQIFCRFEERILTPRLIFHFCPGESNFGCSSACQPFLSKRLKWLRLEFEQVGEGQDGFKATGVKNMNVELGAMASERSLRAAV